MLNEASEPHWLIRLLAYALSGASLLFSLCLLYVKLLFWGGMTYSPLYDIVGLWYLILAGPLAVGLALRRHVAAIITVLLQVVTIVLLTALHA